MKIPAFINIILQPCGATCNLNCEYCYVHPRNALFGDRFIRPPSPPDIRSGGEIFLSWFPLLLKRINEIEQISQLRFTWHGGEPLLLPGDFYKKAVELENCLLKRKDLQWDNVITTNGILLTKKRMKDFRTLDFSVGLSCDGPSFEHNRPRMGDRRTFQKLMRALENLKEENMDFSMISVIHRFNRPFADDIFSMALDYGPRYGISITPCYNADASISKEEFADFLIELYDLWKLDKSLEISLFKNIELGLSYKAPRFCQLIGKRCGSFITAAYDGYLFTGCQIFPTGEFGIGSILEKPFEKLIETHIANSSALEACNTGKSIFSLLGEKISYVYFQGKGCPNRIDETGQDIYAHSFVSLIKHIFESGSGYFEEEQQQRLKQWNLL